MHARRLPVPKESQYSLHVHIPLDSMAKLAARSNVKRTLLSRSAASHFIWLCIEMTTLHLLLERQASMNAFELQALLAGRHFASKKGWGGGAGTSFDAWLTSSAAQVNSAD